MAPVYVLKRSNVLGEGGRGTECNHDDGHQLSQARLDDAYSQYSGY